VLSLFIKNKHFFIPYYFNETVTGPERMLDVSSHRYATSLDIQFLENWKKLISTDSNLAIGIKVFLSASKSGTVTFLYRGERAEFNFTPALQKLISNRHIVGCGNVSPVQNILEAETDNMKARLIIQNISGEYYLHPSKSKAQINTAKALLLLSPKDHELEN
jgi:hypothetical protein